MLAKHTASNEKAQGILGLTLGVSWTLLLDGMAWAVILPCSLDFLRNTKQKLEKL